MTTLDVRAEKLCELLLTGHHLTSADTTNRPKSHTFLYCKHTQLDRLTTTTRNRHKALTVSGVAVIWMQKSNAKKTKHRHWDDTTNTVFAGEATINSRLWHANCEQVNKQNNKRTFFYSLLNKRQANTHWHLHSYNAIVCFLLDTLTFRLKVTFLD